MLPLMVVKSPKCDEMVTLPAGLTPDTRVRCPFTKEEFLVQEILDNLPPMLEVLDRPVGVVAAVTTAATAAVAGGGEPGLLVTEEVTPEAALTGDAETAVAGEAAPAESVFDFFGEGGTAVAESEPKASSESLFEPASPSAAVAAGAFDFAAADVEAATVDGTGATATRRLTARPRPKRKPKSAGAEIVKVALGGVAGLFIAQMILWWLPGSWARDPANLAPKLPGFLSWAAPERLRNPDGVQAESGNDGGASTSETSQASAKPIVNQDDPKILNTPFALPGADDQTPGTGGEVLDPKPEDMAQNNGGPSTTDGVDPLDNISIDNPLAQLPPPEELIGVRSAPVFSGEDLGESLGEANEAKGTIDAAGGLDLTNGRPQAAAFYKAFCKLAERATFVDPAGQQVESRLGAIEGMLLELGENTTNLDSIGRLADTWIGLKDKRPGDGIMLAGTVRSIASQGQVYTSEIELFSDDKQMVTVVSKLDPRKKFDESDRVIILGTVVQEPSLKLAGYDGSLPLVIWGGFPVALPKADASQPKDNGKAPGKQG